jgi:uncharacterized RDD family membrane protein YckC
MHISIQTAHNVTIEYAVASVADRMLAVLIDGLVQLAYVFLLIYLFSYIENHHLANLPIWVFVVVIYLPIIFYEVISEILLEGQTLGKKALNIKVIQLDGSQPSISSFVIRWLIRLLEVSSLGGSIALIALFISSKGQRLGDVAANTTVVKLKAQAHIKRPSISEIEDKANYMPLFPEVIKLSDKDINVAREVLQSYRQTSNMELIKTMNYRLKEILGIYHTNLSETDFLRQLVKDYDNLTAHS